MPLVERGETERGFLCFGDLGVIGIKLIKGADCLHLTAQRARDCGQLNVTSSRPV